MVLASPAVMGLSLTGQMAHKKERRVHAPPESDFRRRSTAIHLAANPSAGTPTASRIQGVRSYLNIMETNSLACRAESSPALATWR